MKYQIWVTFEKWDGDSKICDVETCLVGEVADEDAGRQVFDAVQSLGLCVKDHLDPMVRFIE